MNNNITCGNSGKGRDPITIVPSARPGIHDYRECLFSNRLEMGRYGVHDSPRSTLPQLMSGDIDQGEDEVDNIQSKLSRSSTPLMARQRNKKRNSLCHEYSEESERNILSKSLPGSLPSYYNYSSDFENSNEFATDSFASAQSKASPRKQYLFGSCDGETTSSERRNSSNNLKNRANPCKRQQNQNMHQVLPEGNRLNMSESRSFKSLTVLLVLLTIGVAVASLYGIPQEIFIGKSGYQEKDFYKDIVDLGLKYNLSEDSVLKLKIGISTILKNQDAGSFVFVYNSNEASFDVIKFNVLMNAVASSAARFLRSNIQIQHLTVEASELDMQTHSELISKYREDVTKTGVMLVKEIDRVPSTLAMAFHYYCDEYNPLVKNSAIFFTLDIANCLSVKASQSMFVRVENCLAKKWSSVPEENIGPLLTRVVSTIVDVV